MRMTDDVNFKEGQSLPRSEFDELFPWPGKLAAGEWEKRIEEESLEGKLDSLIVEATEG